MLSKVEIEAGFENIFRLVAEGAWEAQASHERFLFKKAREHDNPSRIAWANANNLWRDQVRARNAARLAT